VCIQPGLYGLRQRQRFRRRLVPTEVHLPARGGPCVAVRLVRRHEPRRCVVICRGSGAAYVAFAATAPDDDAPSRFVPPNDADLVAYAETGGKVYLGGYKAAAEALALAQLVKDELDKIQDEFNGHVHGIPPLTSPSGAVTAVGSGANFAAVSGPVDNVSPWVVPRSYTASPVASNRVFSDEEG